LAKIENVESEVRSTVELFGVESEDGLSKAKLLVKQREELKVCLQKENCFQVEGEGGVFFDILPCIIS